MTDEELGDETLPHVLRANPHKSSWSDMKLFLRCQVEEFAVKKWGSLAGIEAEIDKRNKGKLQRKEKKFKKKLTELRSKTRTENWVKKQKASSSSSLHEHVFVVSKHGMEKKCQECGLVIEEEDL